MNDTLREYFSYGSFIMPLLKVKKEIIPRKIQWGDKCQYFLHYSAPAPKSDTLVLYIHGGGWNSGSPKDFHFIGQKIAKEGFDCIMPGYRKSPKFRYEDIADDIFRGYAHIRKYLASQEKTYSKVVVMGSSAGGHLGALLCVDRTQQEKYGILSDEFAGFISFGGPVCFDFPQTWTLNTLMKDLFGSKDLSVWKTGEPLSKFQEKSNTKMLFIQSRHDGLIGYEQAEKFYARARELGMKAEICDVPEKQNTHSAYTAGIFLKDRSESTTLDKVFEWIECV